MKIVSCFVNFPFIFQWQKEQTTDSPAPLHSMCKDLGKSELPSNHKWNSLIYWSSYTLGKWGQICTPLNVSTSVWTVPSVLAQRNNTCTAHPKQRQYFLPSYLFLSRGSQRATLITSLFLNSDPLQLGREWDEMSKALSQEKAYPYFVLQCLNLIISLISSLLRSSSIPEGTSLVGQ